MGKTFVVDPEEGQAKIPFLRGILTSSLHNAGLPIEEAYTLASKVREELDGRRDVTRTEIRKIVRQHIAADAPEFLERYEQPAGLPGTILVRDSSGQTTQFSRHEHQRVLESSGLSYEDSATITSMIFAHLVNRKVTEIGSHELGALTYRYLRLKLGSRAARRYLVLVKFLRRERPIVILIGGAPGTGKSALATEIAQRLEIVRIQSSDLLREVMRMMIPERLIPVLHKSSYDAWQALPGSADADDSEGNYVIDGYLAQAELLKVPCEAVINRSLHEESSLILEGVHVHQATVDLVASERDAIVIPIMLAVLSRDKLRDRFKGRGKHADQRHAERYLDHFDAIWRLQSHLLSEGDRQENRIVVSNNREQVIHDAMTTIVEALSKQLKVDAKEVFA